MAAPRQARAARLLIAALCALCVWAASASASVPFDKSHFVEAIKDASVPEASEIDRDLFPLSGDNQRLLWREAPGGREVLTAAVMTADTYRSFYAAGAGTTPSSKPVVWVTLAPQLRDWCRHLRQALREDAKRLRQRVLQRLGLSPTTPYDKVVELWVDPGKVFRPCPDPSTADAKCELEMKGTPRVEGIADYPSFFASLYVGAYSTEGAPWTRLGYTYDWGGDKKEFGASEYMLTTSTRYEVRSAGSVSDYCG